MEALLVIGVMDFMLTMVLFCAITVYVHRYLTHQSFVLSRWAIEPARFIVWLCGGMFPPEWWPVHAYHHETSDTKFDPHSPWQNGRSRVLTVLLFNGVIYNRWIKSHRHIVDGILRERGYRVDWLDRNLYSRGWLGWITLFLLQASILSWAGVSLWLTPLAWVLAMLGFLAGGGVINAVGHSNPAKGKNGDHSRNLPWILCVLTLGEGTHENHHTHPGSWRFNQKWWWDPGSVIIMALMKLGLASEPVRERV